MRSSFLDSSVGLFLFLLFLNVADLRFRGCYAVADVRLVVVVVVDTCYSVV
jgi:hypothetical protein